MLTLMIALACRPAPSMAEIKADRDQRAARLQLPSGECWVLDRLPPDHNPAGCVPGPVVHGWQRSFDLVVDTYDRRAEFDPDDMLRIGVALQRIGSPAGWIQGSRMQVQALQTGVSSELVVNLAPLRPNDDLIVDTHLHDTAGVVLENPAKDNRQGFALMSKLMDADPRPAVEDLDDLAMQAEGTAAGVMWANTELMLETSRAADTAWAQALAATPSPPD